MDAKEAAEFINKMKPKIAVPTHFGGMAGTEGADKVFKSGVGSDIEVVLKIGY